jgi:predicted regulator of Ras-like GTPase activity (Roadblock/LC7/MglB family)
MSPAEALTDLADLSAQVRVAVLAERDGSVLASTLADDDRSERIATAARSALASADRLRAHGDAQVTALEAALDEGSLFVARDDGVVIAATTGPDEPAGLVLYDLRACLRRLAEDA